MTTKKIIKSIGNTTAWLISDYDQGEYYDTKVEIEAGTLCVISGAQRLEFLKEINEVINKYRI